jgi:D-alanyl-D-alanine dipeptidase
MSAVQEHLRFKPFANYVLWRVGLRRVLPSIWINRIPIHENGDPLVAVDATAVLFDQRLASSKDVLLRREVHLRLLEAKNNLPRGHTFKLYDAFRSLEEQTSSWKKRLVQTRRLHPELPEDEIRRLTSLKVANPEAGFGGHQTGGALDLTVCDDQGNELDMGCGIGQYDDTTTTMSSSITRQQQRNRRLLRDAMEKASFVNFPAEWWHYCYGDRMWAAYSRHRFAYYGQAEVRN